MEAKKMKVICFLGYMVLSKKISIKAEKIEIIKN